MILIWNLIVLTFINLFSYFVYEKKVEKIEYFCGILYFIVFEEKNLKIIEESNLSTLSLTGYRLYVTARTEHIYRCYEYRFGLSSETKYFDTS